MASTKEINELTIAPSDLSKTFPIVSLFSVSSFRSYPAQKLPPTPYRTATGDSSSFSKASIAAESSTAAGELMQFLTSARLTPISVTAPVFSVFTNGSSSAATTSAGGSEKIAILVI